MSETKESIWSQGRTFLSKKSVEGVKSKKDQKVDFKNGQSNQSFACRSWVL